MIRLAHDLIDLFRMGSMGKGLYTISLSIYGEFGVTLGNGMKLRF